VWIGCRLPEHDTIFDVLTTYLLSKHLQLVVCCAVASELDVDEQVPRCGEGDSDDDEDCATDSSGATGDFLLPHNDASVHHPASTSSSSSTLSFNRTADRKPPLPATTVSATQVSPIQRGVASKRSGTDDDGGVAADSGDPGGTEDPEKPGDPWDSADPGDSKDPWYPGVLEDAGDWEDPRGPR